jgi:hypothetical protein
MAERNGPSALAGAAEAGIRLTIACPDTTNWRGAASAFITASEWRPLERNTLKGFLTLPSGLTLRECSLHEKDRRRWVGLPSPIQIAAKGGRYRTDPVGKRPYIAIAEIPDKTARERFNSPSRAAVSRLLGDRGASHDGRAPR